MKNLIKLSQNKKSIALKFARRKSVTGNVEIKKYC